MSTSAAAEPPDACGALVAASQAIENGVAQDLAVLKTYMLLLEQLTAAADDDVRELVRNARHSVDQASDVARSHQVLLKRLADSLGT